MPSDHVSIATAAAAPVNNVIARDDDHAPVVHAVHPPPVAAMNLLGQISVIDCLLQAGGIADGRRLGVTGESTGG